MLNIGRLAPGAADYYVGEVATSAEDYYSGKGESEGRWVGSLAGDIGLDGAVSPEHFRAVLDGRHPLTGEQLARSRNHCSRRSVGDPNQETLFDAELDIGRVATRLKLTVGRVRQLAWAGQEAQRGERRERFLVGRKVPRPDGRRPMWVFRQAEVERFQAEHATRRTRPGYDITLRPPKSVSVLWALADPSDRAAIRQAHREAVDAVVTHLEQHAVFARQGTKDRGRIETDGVIAAAFDHRTSRAGDPLLHTHVVTANLTRTAEGRWQAIDGRPIYTNARPAGFLYQAHLRQLLSARLGVEWTDVRNGWAEIEGVPKEVVRAFSKRRDEIEEMVAEAGYTSAGAHQVATLATRKAKQYGVDADTLQGRWRDEAAALGFGPTEVDACFGRSSAVAEPDIDALFEALSAPDGLTRHASTFDRGDVVEAIADRMGAGLDAEFLDRLADRFLGSPRAVSLNGEQPAAELVWRRDGSRTRSLDFARWSTPELLALEGRLLEQAREQRSPDQSPPRAAVDAALATRPELSDEQVAMVEALCDSGAPPIQPVAGRPGSGKTYAVAAVVEAMTSSDIPVVGVSLSAAAAAELEDSTSLRTLTGREASTIARFLFQADRSPLSAGTVVIVDEASMVGTRDLARIADHVERAGGAMKLIGDPDQHGAVETGGFFRLLCEAQGDDLVSLVENNRQRDDGDRSQIDRFREGLVANALAGYDAAGRVHRSATAPESYDALVAEWWRTASGGSRDPMIAGPNIVRRALNQRARRLLGASGALSGQPVVEADREYLVGDWVVARRNDRTLTSETGRWVKNGSAGIVEATHPDTGSLTVRFDREGTVLVPNEYLTTGHLDHGYARTTYGVQGATLDRALYHAGDEASFEEGYVALTRGRHETRIFLVDGAATSTVEHEETGHKAHDSGATGLSTVAAAMDQRRAKTLAHETDPIAARSASLAGRTLADLAIERAGLERVMEGAPRDVSKALLDVCKELDRVRARSRIADASVEDLVERSGSRNLLTRRRAADDLEVARRTASGLAQQIDRLSEREDSLRSLWRVRQRFLDEHRAEAERLTVVRHAERSRAVEVRAAAAFDPPAAALVAVGPEPASLAERQAWLHAVGEVAIHLDRHGSIDAHAAGFEGWSNQQIEQAFGALRRASQDRAAQPVSAGVELEL